MEAIRDAESEALRIAEEHAAAYMGYAENIIEENYREILIRRELEEHENDVAHGADMDSDGSSSGNNGENKSSMEKEV